MCEQEKETYPKFRERVRDIVRDTKLLKRLRMKQPITGQDVLRVAGEMLRIVQEELAGPARLDMGLEVIGPEEYKDGGEQVYLSLHDEAYFVVAREPKAGYGCFIKYGHVGIRREDWKRSPHHACEMALGKLEEMLLEFLQWYAEGCPLPE